MLDGDGRPVAITPVRESTPRVGAGRTRHPGRSPTPLTGQRGVEPRAGEGPARPGVPPGRVGSAHEIAAVAAMGASELPDGSWRL